MKIFSPHVFFALLITLLFAGHAFAEERADVIMPHVDYITVENPTAEQAVIDAHDAIKAKDWRFMMVAGVVVECPGINMDTRVFSLVKKYGVKGLNGTGDSFKSDAAKRLNDQLNDYAIKYNKLLLAAYKKETE